MLGIVNDIRANPSKYAPRIQTLYLDHFDERGVNKRTGFKANEGIEVYKEAMKFLEKQTPLPPLKLDVGLTAAAYLHSDYMAEINELTHRGRNGTTSKQRAFEFGDFSEGTLAVGENILNEKTIVPEEFFLQFIIDDGSPGRGHREVFFDTDYAFLGMEIGRAHV